MQRVSQKVNRIVFPLLLVLLGCDLPRETQPSVLIIAVEGLSFESLGCDSDETGDRLFEDIRPFCEESVRFSHAFAPSPMSQASMASLMTGLYPFDHGVHHNGAEFLSARFHTVSEAALSKGYHTLFVSGGAPIWRKSGLAQGFEVFDDSVDISPGNYYRPAGEVVKIATNWLDHESTNAPFLSVLYLSDLQFPQIATKTTEGEVREKTSDAQLEEVGESLAKMVKWLKKKRKWNSTNVVLVGLNSLQHRENDTEPLPLSPKSASVQVTLFIKPARKERDNVIQWAVDRSVSLVDVGRTIFDWIGAEPAKASVEELEPESLVNAVTQSEPNWREGRLILSESAWPDWLEGSGTRFALRQNHFLYIADQKPQIFNTLTDRMETLPLKVNDPLWMSLNGEVMTMLKQANLKPWQGMQSHWPDQIEVARELWHLDQANRHPSKPEPWSRWYLRRALLHRDWHEVKRLANLLGDATGVFVASRNLGENVSVPHSPCVRLVLAGKGDKKLYQAECEDEGVLALHAWQNSHSEEDRLLTQDHFIRLYSLQLMDQEIGRLNYLNELRWDVERELPEAPQPLDYLLTLKELEPFAKKTSSLLSNKDMAF